MAGNVTVVTDDTFDTLIVNSNKPALVDFWAVWCGPCRIIAPHIEALSNEFSGRAVVAKLDVDSNRNTAVRFGIQSIPTLLFFKGGKVADRVVGRSGRTCWRRNSRRSSSRAETRSAARREIQLLTLMTPRGPLACERLGSGAPLLMLAGLGSRARLWGELPRILSNRFTVLAPDNRGVGGSRAGDGFTLEGAADDAAQILKEQAGQPAGVLGVSMGGLIACTMAARHPALVGRMVVASCGARLTRSHRRVLRFFELVLTRLSPDEAAEALMAFAFGAAFADQFPGFVDQAARLWTLDPEDVPGALAQIEHLRSGWDLDPL